MGIFCVVSSLCCHSQFLSLTSSHNPRAVMLVVMSFMTMRWAFKVTRVVHTNALVLNLELALQSFDSIPSAPKLCLAVKYPALLQHKRAAVSSGCLAWQVPACLAWVQQTFLDKNSHLPAYRSPLFISWSAEPQPKGLFFFF